MSRVSFVVRYKPRKGKAIIPTNERHRMSFQGGKARAYTPSDTKFARQQIVHAWSEAGMCQLPDEAIRLSVRVFVPRPSDHWLPRGRLAASGRRMGLPFKSKPDLDNVVKLVGDALNGHAWTDDVRITTGTQERQWAEPGTPARIEVWAEPDLPRLQAELRSWSVAVPSED